MTDLAFNGSWVRRGAVLVPVPDTPEPDDDVLAGMLVGVLTAVAGQRSTKVTGTCCEDCGCLLRHVDELCPSCVVPWCEKAAEAGFWVAYEAVNRRGGSKKMQKHAMRLTENMIR